MGHCDEGQLRVCTRSALGAAPGHELPLNEIAAAGAEKTADGRIFYVAGLWVEFADTITALSTQLGDTPGRRLQDFVSTLQLNLPGWPDRTVFRASGRALRQRSIGLTKKIPVADGAAISDADATVTDQRRVLYIPFRKYVTGYKPNDFCIPAALFDRGSLLLDLTASPITGLTLYDTDVVVRADMKLLTPRQPTPWRFMEYTPTLDQAFRVPTNPEAICALWAYLTGQRSADGSENQFGPTVGCRLKVGGQEILDGRITIQELAESFAADLSDAAADPSGTAPTLLALMNYGRGVKSTQLPGAVPHFPIFEGSAAITAASGNGSGYGLRVCAEEILAAPVGSHPQVSFMRQMGATGPVEVKTDAAAKRPLKSVGTAVRLPKKIRSLAASVLSTRSRYGF